MHSETVLTIKKIIMNLVFIIDFKSVQLLVESAYKVT